MYTLSHVPPTEYVWLCVTTIIDTPSPTGDFITLFIKPHYCFTQLPAPYYAKTHPTTFIYAAVAGKGYMYDGYIESPMKLTKWVEEYQKYNSTGKWKKEAKIRVREKKMVCSLTQHNVNALVILGP